MAATLGERIQRLTAALRAYHRLQYNRPRVEIRKLPAPRIWAQYSVVQRYAHGLRVYWIEPTGPLAAERLDWLTRQVWE